MQRRMQGRGTKVTEQMTATPGQDRTRTSPLGARRGGRLARAGLVVGVLVATTGAGLLGTAGTAAAADPDRIVITQTPIASVSSCAPSTSTLGYEVWSDDSIFRLRIRAAAPLCTPVTATAAIYSMPTDGSLWPQTLQQTKSFTIAEAGVTDIVFDKDCTASQFDVVTGATPRVITPLGEHHGPLLINDATTAFQDPGLVCEPNSSTTTAPGVATSTPTSTPGSTPANPSTTAANPVGTVAPPTTAVVLGTTSIAAPTTSRPASVLGIADPTGSDPDGPASLAVTGVSSTRTGFLGMSFLCVGIALIVATRRRGLGAVRIITSAPSVNPVSPFSID